MLPNNLALNFPKQLKFLEVVTVLRIDMNTNILHISRLLSPFHWI